MSLFVAALFFVLTPGIVLSLPPKGSKVVVALTHALVFAVIYGLTHKLVYQYLYEGFAATPIKKDEKGRPMAAGDAAKRAAERATM